MARICVFGDSITWGDRDHENGGWVGRLHRDASTRHDIVGDILAVFNLGVPGHGVRDVLARFEVETIARRPAAIVLAVGINDRTMPTELFAQHYGLLLEQAKSEAIDVLAVTPTNVDESRQEHDYRNADIARITDCVKQSSAAAGVACVDVFGLLDEQDLQPDGLHPGSRGHQKLYEQIAPELFKLRCLRGT